MIKILSHTLAVSIIPGRLFSRKALPDFSRKYLNASFPFAARYGRGSRYTAMFTLRNALLHFSGSSQEPAWLNRMYSSVQMLPPSIICMYSLIPSPIPP